MVTTLVALVVGLALFAPDQRWFDLGRFGDVGTVSTFLVMVLPLFLLFALRSAPRSPERVGALIVAGACIAAGSLTLNRMFWLAAAAEITLFALFSMRYWALALPHRPRCSPSGRSSPRSPSSRCSPRPSREWRWPRPAPTSGNSCPSDPRGDLWRFATARIAEHPWIGAGLGKWTSSEAFVVQFGDPMLMHAHNTFLNRALETGLPGLAAFVYLLGSVVVAFLARRPERRSGHAAIGAAGLALVAGVVVKNLTDDFLRAPERAPVLVARGRRTRRGRRARGIASPPLGCERGRRGAIAPTARYNGVGAHAQGTRRPTVRRRTPPPSGHAGHSTA